MLEVETPTLSKYAVTEPNIQSLKTHIDESAYYLQTSPEYFMKRLLAAGAPDIYQISKAFRASEYGVNHNPEFTLVEWYRHQFDLQQMMSETADFVRVLLETQLDDEQAVYVRYFDAMRQALGVDVQQCSYTELLMIAQKNGLQTKGSLSIDQLYDFIFSTIVVASFSPKIITVVYHYPASQASLAKLSVDNSMVADRFEVFVGNKELANGFVELTDADEQVERFKRDQQLRENLGLVEVDIDEKFIAALRHGLPACAGVAVGLDRVAMLVAGSSSISEMLSFSWSQV